MSDYDALHQAAQAFIARGHAQLAARALALAHLAIDSEEGRTAPHTPVSQPWPDNLATAWRLLTGGTAGAELDADALAEALRAHPVGAAYLAAWEEGARAQWGAGEVLLSPAARMLLNSLSEDGDA